MHKQDGSYMYRNESAQSENTLELNAGANRWVLSREIKTLIDWADLMGTVVPEPGSPAQS